MLATGLDELKKKFQDYSIIFKYLTCSNFGGLSKAFRQQFLINFVIILLCILNRYKNNFHTRKLIGWKILQKPKKSNH